MAAKLGTKLPPECSQGRLRASKSAPPRMQALTARKPLRPRTRTAAKLRAARWKRVPRTRARMAKRKRAWLARSRQPPRRRHRASLRLLRRAPLPRGARGRHPPRLRRRASRRARPLPPARRQAAGRHRTRLAHTGGGRMAVEGIAATAAPRTAWPGTGGGGRRQPSTGRRELRQALRRQRQRTARSHRTPGGAAAVGKLSRPRYRCCVRW